MKGGFLFKLYKRMGNLKIWGLFNMLHKNILGCTRKSQKSQESQKILKEYAKLRKQVISLCCKIVVIIGYVKLIERRRNHECIR